MKITFSPIANDHSFSKRVLYKKHFSWLNVPAPAKEEKILSEFYQSMRPASPMVRRKRDFFEWEFTKEMNAVGL